MNQLSPSFSLTFRLQIHNKPGMLGKITSAIGELKGDIGAIDLVSAHPGHLIRDITVNVQNSEHGDQIIAQLKTIEGVTVLNVSDQTFLLHLGGKIEVVCKSPLKTRDDLSRAYTPGVGRICEAIARNPDDVYRLTMKKNSVAIVTDGSAVLGLGNIGPRAALPVMEGKAMLFKEFGAINAFPICLESQDTEEIIRTIQLISTPFGGINLEDISAPRCFEIEERLRDLLDIPVFHDDQHGTAVVVLAALINDLKIVQKPLHEIKVVVSGIGAAGTACIKMMLSSGVKKIIACDREGMLYTGRKKNMDRQKVWVAEHSNPEREAGDLSKALKGADVFLGLSGPDVMRAEWLKTMASDAIVFALANPVPEVMPEEAAPYVRIMATGRSDYSNQINNVLCFPGIFRGALDCRAKRINEEMKLAAARAIASLVLEDQLTEDYIIPSIFNRSVGETVAREVLKAAVASEVSQRK
ncbi:MAG: NAD-dependent malic enzyme [Nitrospirae bacterium]|nr:NAD-dependent malic enzyme [Nitrospirota bacterium]